jgi:hypothetical protein
MWIEYLQQVERIKMIRIFLESRMGTALPTTTSLKPLPALRCSSFSAHSIFLLYHACVLKDCVGAAFSVPTSDNIFANDFCY